MKLYIKYMVSLRCKLMVKEHLLKLGLHFVVAELGMVEILEDLTKEQREQLSKLLKKSGMELLDDTKSSLIEKIKVVVADLIKNADPSQPMDFATALPDTLGYQQELINDIFSEVEGISVRQFIVINKVEQVKELLLYDDMTLDKIAARLHFKSRFNLAYQFKKVTGLTPSYYKELKEKRKINRNSKVTASKESLPGKDTIK